MRKIGMLTLLLTIVTAAWAVPAKKCWRTMTQPDGTSVELMLLGDESFHYFITRDSIPVMEVNRAYYYAQPKGFAMASTGVLAHEPELRTQLDAHNIYSMEDIQAMQEFAVKKGPQTVRSRRALRVGEEDHADYIGHKKGLIILANFSDKKFYDYTEEDGGHTTWVRYDALANDVGYTNDYGAIGSVHDFYYNQSYGKFNLEFDVVGPITLSQSYSFYGQGDDNNAPLMIKECCELVDPLVDFNDYDWDGDGVAEEVFVLYAGYGEATGGYTDTVWPHMWEMESAAYYYSNLGIPNPFVLDGCQINVYACSNELYDNSGHVEMGLGVICHEFSHCLGLPDLYDTSRFPSNFGMGSWDILDSGSYNGPAGLGWVPAGYSCYERWFAGWMKPSEMKKSRRIANQKPINEKGQCYIIYNDNHRDEYFILENRNQTDWDFYLPGSGLLIVHVDYDENAWYNNTVNSTAGHERLTIFHASNSNYGGHDAYPYMSKDSLTDTSTPAAKLWNRNTDGKKLMHKPITEITRDEATAKISFLYRNLNETSAIEAPTVAISEESVDVYRLDGVRIATLGRAADVQTLPKGIYVVRMPNGESRKVEVR